MTANHTKLCERLREVLSYLIPIPAQEILVKTADLIESQAARIAELEKERDAILSKVESTLVHERSLYLSKWKREAFTACTERVAALQAEKETK